MKKWMLWMAAFVMLAGGAMHAQDITGTWQGTLQAPKPARIVVKIAKTDKGMSATLYNVDQGGQGISGTLTLQDGTVKINVVAVGGGYEGKLSADNTTMAGTLNFGQPLTLNLTHVTDAAAWEIPAFVPEKLMAADADPSFDVATIKPNNSGATSMQRLTMNGRDFKVRAGSLDDLISFAYGVQVKQIIGAPEWANTDRFDIDAVPDHEGAPSRAQLCTMIQKLLTERFALKLHHEKKDLSAFVLTVGKGGEKLTPTQMTGPLPGLGSRPGPTGVTMSMVNGTITDLTGYMQVIVLDRPVVDQTALTGKYDLHVTFTPDET
jgi:uncharacterized protein (TIGR03435 family)